MDEIELPLFKVPDGSTYRNGTDDPAFVIEQNHTIRDVLRHLLKEVPADELRYQLDDLSPPVATVPLSKSAQNMLTRLRKGAWYTWDPNKMPKAMQELVDAGLVTTGGRVKVATRCWVPVGYIPARMEQFPEKWDV
jgi:hypothetical protein